MTTPKTIFITGAASGIGRATARLFVANGWFVGCIDANSAGLDSLRDELGDHRVFYQTLDVADRSAFAEAISHFGQATGGRLDVLFNNAGIIRGGFFDEMSWDDISKMVNVNLLGVLGGIHAAIPLLKATPGSLCISTSSAAAIFGTARISVYSATKHAVKGLTEALSVELSRHGIRVSDVLPGVIDTAMVTDEMRGRLPADGMWRLIPPTAIAEAVWHAYHADVLHVYIPSDLYELAMDAVAKPEAVRDQRRQLLSQQKRLV